MDVWVFFYLGAIINKDKLNICLQLFINIVFKIIYSNWLLLIQTDTETYFKIWILGNALFSFNSVQLDGEIILSFPFNI